MRKYNLNQPLWLRNIYKQCSELIVDHKRIIRHLPFMIAGLAMCLGVFINLSNLKEKKSETVQQVQASIPAGYYDAVTDDLINTDLLNTLNGIIDTNDVAASYDWDRFRAADEDPNNTDNVILIYSRISMPKSQKDPGSAGFYWNREHTFPQSNMSNTKAKNDNHIVFASEKKVNGDRGDKPMGVVNSGTVVTDYNGDATTCMIGNGYFDPHNVARGIVARSTMYAAVMYGYSPETNFESIATMLRWHLEYTPDANDQRRNEVVYTNQHNRNPFVDHPEYACRIWGRTNSTTKSICGITDKTLSSISVETAPTKTTYVAGETFDPTGLVIRRNYSDSTSDTYTYVNHTSEFSFSPSLSTALSTSNSSITITYGSKSTTQSITVSQAVVTSIYASVNKTYYVGETIKKADITVKDNLNNTITDFTFNNNNYNFLYSDASSGGALTNKLFSSSISYNGKTCSLSVQVQRKEYASPSETKSVTYTDLPTTYQTSTTERTAASGIKYIAYNLANYSSKMQFKASGGYFQTTQEMQLKTVTLNNRETNALTVYGSNTSSSFSTTINGTNDVYDLTGYKYVKVMKNGNGAAYCASISITYGSGSETPNNVANYIMYTDSEGQCTTKLSKALEYFKALSSSDKNTFQTSNGYVISTARERIEAWARSQGKTINYSNGELNNNRSGVCFFSNQESNNAIIMIIIISTLGVSSAGLCLYMRKRKQDR